MHDKPGIVVLDATSRTFTADLEAALEDGYALFCTAGNMVVLKRGY